MKINIEFPTLESALIAFNEKGEEYYPEEREIACVASKPCPDCQQRVYFLLPMSATQAYSINHHVGQSFPMLNADQRERFITGYCVPCWNDLFAYVDDQLDDDE